MSLRVANVEHTSDRKNQLEAHDANDAAELQSGFAFSSFEHFPAFFVRPQIESEDDEEKL